MNKVNSIIFLTLCLHSFGVALFSETQPEIVGKVAACSGFTTIQRDFSNQQISKGAKIYSSDQITCDNGKAHLIFGSLDLWMGKNSKIIHLHKNNNHTIQLVKGDFLIKALDTDQNKYSLTTDIVKISNFIDKCEFHIQSNENHNQIISLKNSLTIVQKDIHNHHYKKVTLKQQHLVQFSKFKNTTPSREIEEIESVYYNEHLLLPSEVAKAGPKSLDSFKPYLPEKEIMSKSRKWLRMNKDETNINQTQLSNFNTLINLSNELSRENLNEALQEDDAFSFPIPIAVPISTQ